MPVRVLLFGPPRLETTGATPPLPRARGRALLAYLATTGRPTTRDALAALLWPDHAPADARNNLRRELSLLRQALGEEMIAADRAHVALDPAALGDGRLWIDVATFEGHVAAAEAHRRGDHRRGDHRHAPGDLCAECVAWLEQAEALYTADFLAGFALPDSAPFDEWQSAVAGRLRAVVDAVRARLAAHHLAQGDSAGRDTDRALDLAGRRLAADPLNEAAHRDRLLALALAGRQSAALAEHEHFARLLAQEIGAPPEPATLALVENVRHQRFAPPAVPRFSRIAPPHPERESQSRHHLPAPTTPFFGRELELAELSRLFADPATRLVTLVGPGGMGKTRLALAWAGGQLGDAEPSPNLSHRERDAAGEPSPNHSQGAGDQRGRFADGVVFVDLAPVPDAGGVIPAVADALRFPLQDGAQDARPPLRQVADYLATRAMLLLLDNAERLLDAAPLLVDLLAAAPGVRLLVTSRERLGVRAETVFAIDGLALPRPDETSDTADYAAGRLFVGAARRVRPQFAADSAADRAQVAAISRLVGGMPLALEMAAAWVDSLTLPQIAAELERGLDLLETEMRDVPARQRSVRAAIDTSWQRLDEPDRHVFARLSVFSGGMTADAASIITGATPRQLASLVRKGLLHSNAAGDRFRLHELLCQFAAERLDEDPPAAAAARDGHAHFYARLLAGVEPHLRDDEAHVLARLDADSDNVDAALGRLLATRAAGPLLGTLNALCLYRDSRLRPRDAHDACARIIAVFDPTADGRQTRPDDTTRLLLARAINWRVYFHLKLSDERDSVPPALAQARALLAGLDGRDLPLTDDLALNAYLAGDPGLAMDYNDDSVASFESAYRLFAQTGNTWGMAVALHRLFMGYTYGGHAQPATTRALAERALAFAAALPNRRLRAEVLSELLQYAVHFDERGLLAPLAAEMEKDLAAAPDASPGEAQNRGRYAWPLLLLGRVDEALACYRLSLDARLAYGLPYLMRDAHFYGRLLLHGGHYDEAAVQFQRGRFMAQANDSNFIAWLVRVLDAIRLMAIGRPAEAEQVLSDALKLNLSLLAEGDMAGHWTNTGLALALQGRWADARPALWRGLRGAIAVYNYLPLIEVLPAIALTLAHSDPPRLELAAQTSGLALGQPYYATGRHFQDSTGHALALALTALPPAIAAVAQARGRALPLWPAAEALLDEITALGWPGD